MGNLWKFYLTTTLLLFVVDFNLLKCSAEVDEDEFKVLQARVAKLEAASSGRTLSNAKELHRSLDYFQNSFSKLVKSVKKAYPVTDNEAPNAGGSLNLPGGLGPVVNATEETQALIDNLRNKIQEKAQRNYTVFRAVQYRVQVVAGQNFFIKVDVGEDENIHVRIFKPLPFTGNPPQLSSLQTGKKLGDTIEYFSETEPTSEDTNLSGDSGETTLSPEDESMPLPDKTPVIGSLPGGLGSVSDATEETQALIDNLKSEIEKEAKRKFTVFKAVQYRVQVVAGQNFFIKVNVGEDEHIHVRIFKPLQYQGKPPQFSCLQTGKKLGDTIEYFSHHKGHIMGHIMGKV